MVNKEVLKKQFSAEWKMHYAVDLFQERGFIRKQCPTCQKNFWTLDPERADCGDPPCVQYTFIGNPMTRKRFDYHSMWRNFRNYFKKQGHTIINRYPVVARWRPDLYFTIASIADFQPFVVSGEVEPPANPLIVPQTSIRFVDIPNVGVTGRHLTSFVMTGQHAFNSPSKYVYWKNECLTMNWDYLTKTLGIPAKEITALEDVWVGGGNFGPSIEYMCRGLEISNQVFMQFQETASGYEELKTRVIDVGWGHSRLVWASQGTPTAYEGVFGPVIARMKKESKIDIDEDLHLRYAEQSAALDVGSTTNLDLVWKQISKNLGYDLKELRKTMNPLRALYAIADHSRTLTFAIADGAIPSNVGGGYNLRVLLRRALTFIDEYDFPFTLPELADWHIDWLKPFFPELNEERDQVKKILGIELSRAQENVTRTQNLVQSIIKKAKISSSKTKSIKIPVKELISLYESHGVTPEQLQNEARTQNIQLKLPTSIYSNLTKNHETAKEHKGDTIKTKDTDLDIPDKIKSTRQLYYEDSHQKTFNAKIQAILDQRRKIILDKTIFYPEGGGQPSDRGKIENHKVKSVEKIGQVIIHNLEIPLRKEFAIGDTIEGSIDWKYRFQHMQHHSGTHLVLSAARKILGNHVWQEGSQIGQGQARIDISHYAQLTQEEINTIEMLANNFVQRNASIKSLFIPRRTAEDKYGFRLYQGGVVPGKIVRVIETQEIDVEACGGTHLTNTGEIGLVIINRTKRIQDGIVRIEFSCGKAALEKLQSQRGLLKQTADILRVTPDQIPKAAQRFFDAWKESQKNKTNGLTKTKIQPKKFGRYLFYCDIQKNTSVKILLKNADAISKDNPNSIVILSTIKPSLRFVVAVGKETELDAYHIATQLGKELGGGSGRVDHHLAQGGGKPTSSNNLNKAIVSVLEKIVS